MMYNNSMKLEKKLKELIDSYKRIASYVGTTNKSNIARESRAFLNGYDTITPFLKSISDLMYNYIHYELVPAEKEKEIRKWCKYVHENFIPLCENKLKRFKKTEPSILELMNVYKKFYSIVAFRSLEYFASYMEWNKRIKKKHWIHAMPSMVGFFKYANKFVLNKDIKLIRSSCPVAYGKSFSFNLTIAFAFGQDPNHRVAEATDSQTLCETCYDNVKNMLLNELFSDVFPYYKQFKCDESKLFTYHNRTKTTFKIAKSNSSYSYLISPWKSFPNGVRTDFILLDDLTSGATDADNVALHKKIVSWFYNILEARADGEDAIRILAGGTMWADYDLLNVLEKNTRDEGKEIVDAGFPYTRITKDGKNIFIGVPSLDYDTGESTMPTKFTTEYFVDRRDNKLTPHMWHARCQQRPLPPEGTSFYWDQLELYETIPQERSDTCYASLDPARKGKNYVSMPIFTYIPKENKYYFKDVIYELKNMEELYDKILDKIEFHRISTLYFENNIDVSFKKYMDGRMKARGINYCEIIEKYATKNKELRISEHSAAIRKGMVFPKRGMFTVNSPIGKFMDHLTIYSFNRGTLYDDAPDSLAMFASKFIKNRLKKNTVKIISRI